jgi:hypothetical protein
MLLAPSPAGCSSTPVAPRATSAPLTGSPTCRAVWSAPSGGHPIQSWEVIDGRPLPGPFSAVWHLPDGPVTYIKGRLAPSSVVFNVAPAARRGAT